MKKRSWMIFVAGAVTGVAVPWLARGFLDAVLFNVNVTFHGEGCDATELVVGSNTFDRGTMSAYLYGKTFPVLLNQSGRESYSGMLDLAAGGEAYLSVDCASGTIYGTGLRRTAPLKIEAPSASMSRRSAGR